MNRVLEPLLTLRFSEIADHLNRAFTGYIVDIRFTTEILTAMVRQDAIDLAASRLVMHGDEIVGIALIARRGAVSRLAAMGIVPEARGAGTGQWMLDRLIEQAQARRESAMLLEVIEQNEAAVRLYTRAGFQKVRRLVGYVAEQGSGLPDDALEEVDLSDVARAVMVDGLPDLPMQLSGLTLGQMALPNRGYRLGPAYAAISDPDHPAITLRSLVVERPYRRQGWASRMTKALMARYPDRTWRVPIIVPEEIAPGFFRTLGFRREPLTQLEMRYDL